MESENVMSPCTMYGKEFMRPCDLTSTSRRTRGHGGALSLNVIIMTTAGRPKRDAIAMSTIKHFHHPHAPAGLVQISRDHQLGRRSPTLKIDTNLNLPISRSETADGPVRSSSSKDRPVLHLVPMNNTFERK
jgi:hypothetical protein